MALSNLDEVSSLAQNHNIPTIRSIPAGALITLIRPESAQNVEDAYSGTGINLACFADAAWFVVSGP